MKMIKCISNVTKGPADDGKMYQHLTFQTPTETDGIDPETGMVIKIPVKSQKRAITGRKKDQSNLMDKDGTPLADFYAYARVGQWFQGDIVTEEVHPYYIDTPQGRRNVKTYTTVVFGNTDEPEAFEREKFAQFTRDRKVIVGQEDKYTGDPSKISQPDPNAPYHAISTGPMRISGGKSANPNVEFVFDPVSQTRIPVVAGPLRATDNTKSFTVMAKDEIKDKGLDVDPVTLIGKSPQELRHLLDAAIARKKESKKATSKD